jgi:CBS domain-containing protein
MTVKTVLSTKGTEVITIAPTASMEQAIATLTQHRIGALVVLGAEGRMIGVLSERDIVRALAEHGIGVLNQPLSQSMTRTVVTCCESDSIAEIMERMTHGRFRHIPVVDDDRLVGIVSIGDVVKQRLTEMERETEALRDYIQTA